MAGAAGDSREQREAEKWLIQALSKELRVRLTKGKIEIDGGGQLELDGYCESPLILCEAWAHIGTPRPAQRNKVMTDALKLLYATKLSGGNGRRILLFADDEAAAPFKGKSWMAQCLKQQNIQVKVIALPPKLREKVIKAQKRQYR